MEHFQKIHEAIDNAINKPCEVHKELSGFSGEKLLSSLMNLSKYNLNQEKVYLEVGVYQGMTLLSVANSLGSKSQVFGIDNFAFFDEDGKNESIVNSRIDKIGLQNVHLINMDYEEALENLSNYIGDKKVGVYFVDGPRDYRSQLMCLLLIQPFLSDDAIIIVDDCNYRHVRQANRDFLQTNNNFKLFFEAYTKSHPKNMTASEEMDARKGWWNGVNIIVRDKDDLLISAWPPTHRERILYENEHIIQASKYPTLPIILNRYITKVGDLAVKLGKKRNILFGTYNAMNTYSEELSTSHFTQRN